MVWTTNMVWTTKQSCSPRPRRAKMRHSRYGLLPLGLALALVGVAHAEPAMPVALGDTWQQTPSTACDGSANRTHDERTPAAIGDVWPAAACEEHAGRGPNFDRASVREGTHSAACRD